MHRCGALSKLLSDVNYVWSTLYACPCTCVEQGCSAIPCFVTYTINIAHIHADSFSCAYSNRILRQGHIYVMLGYVCFHSTVVATVLKIKTSHIQSVVPKNNLLFPNSIEITEV